MKWTKNLLFGELFVLLRQLILLGGQRIHRATCILIIWV
jgi:hypothetical protein